MAIPYAVSARHFVASILGAALAMLGLLIEAGAEVAGPGWIMGTAAPVAISTTGTSPRVLAAAAFPPACDPAGSSPPATPEIMELARALRHDPKLIYEYVHDHVDYVPYYGSLKGATLTYLDGSGNDADQASLMVALLRASGFPARFVFGTMTLPGDGVAAWLGTDPSGDVLGKVLPSGGIPIRGGFVDGQGNVISLDVDRVWVEAAIDGVDYVFDPAFKTYTETAKIDLSTAMDYDRLQLVAAATTGATVGTDFIQNLDEGGVATKLDQYTTNLVATIRADHPNASVAEIIGGFDIVPTGIVGYSTALPFATQSVGTCQEIPASETHTLQIVVAGLTYTFDLPELAGRRLTLTFTGADHHPELRLDGALVASGAATIVGQTYPLTVSVDHPYDPSTVNADQTVDTYKVKSGATYAIAYNFGSTSDTLVRQAQRRLEEALAQGLPDTSEAVLGETLHIMGATWMRETELAGHLLSRLAETVVIPHHKVGVMAQEAGYYIDVRNAFAGIISRHNMEADRSAHFYAASLISSAFEHGTLEQLMGSSNPAVSTMKLFQIANGAGHKIFFADSANYGSIRPQLLNYSGATLDYLQDQVNAGRTLILPRDGLLGLEQWQGHGYTLRSEEVTPQGTRLSLSLIIDGGYFGGFAGNPGQVDAPAINDTTLVTLPDLSRSANQSTPQSRDPVDLATGAYLYNHTDLALGASAPRGLRFTRSYNSTLNRTQGPLGHGWTHGYDIHLSRTSQGDPGLGTRQPVDAAALITELYVALDLMKNQDDLVGWMVTSLANKWAVDRLIDNAITVHLGTQQMAYLRLAGGSYNPPPGVTTDLVDHGDGTFHLQERFGTRLDFDASDRLTQLTDIDGNTLTLVYTGGRLTSVSDAHGRTLTLGYTGDLLTQVTDTAGRSITYGYDADNNLTTFTDPAGKVWSFGYDADHRITTVTDPLAVTLATNHYDSLGRVDTQTVPRQGGGCWQPISSPSPARVTWRRTPTAARPSTTSTTGAAPWRWRTPWATARPPPTTARTMSCRPPIRAAIPPAWCTTVTTTSPTSSTP